MVFQSTLPAREATLILDRSTFSAIFQSTLPAREATRCKRAECDGEYFNPRFPRGKRPTSAPLIHSASRFQSTLPAREATKSIYVLDKDLEFQSTLPAREATIHNEERGDLTMISIHASREGSDMTLTKTTGAAIDFNPRFPRGKRRL